MHAYLELIYTSPLLYAMTPSKMMGMQLVHCPEVLGSAAPELANTASCTSIRYFQTICMQHRHPI